MGTRQLNLSNRMDSPVHWMLLLLFTLTLGDAIFIPKTPLVTLEELRSLNASSDDGRDTCRGRLRGEDDMWNFNCQCGSYCVHFGTCCMEMASLLGTTGNYREGLNCSTTYGATDPVNLVEKCPKEWDGDDSVRDLCVATVADAEEKSDLMLLVPVSSLKTGITYRNYFCYVCNTVDEMYDSFIPWDVRVIIRNVDESLFSGDLSTLTHDRQMLWTFPGAPTHMFLRIHTEPPAKLLENFSIYCREGEVISSCASDWTDDATRSKCYSYTALVHMRNAEGWDDYRNVHCGICNWASTAIVLCKYLKPGDGQGYGRAAKVFQEIFRISEMREDRCPEGKIYDRVTKNCRNFRCGRKMKLVRGRCVRKE